MVEITIEDFDFITIAYNDYEIDTIFFDYNFLPDVYDNSSLEYFLKILNHYFLSEFICMTCRKLNLQDQNKHCKYYRRNNCVMEYISRRMLSRNN